MQSTNIPSKIPLPFANSASSTYKNTIPTASQIGVVNGKASLTDGFPPLTFQAISSGGVPPFGADFNGILYEITSITQWQQAGGLFVYDSSFSTTIGGYPKGSIVQSNTTNGLWLSRIENNTDNPDSGGTNWVPFGWYGNIGIVMSGTSVTANGYQAAYPILTLSGTLTANCNLILPNVAGKWIVQNNTTGSYTVQIKTSAGTGVNVAQSTATYVYGDGTNIYYADGAKVASFNTRTGAVTLNATDVTAALGYIPMQYSVGINQTWQDTTSIRSPGVIYTNTTGQPITIRAQGGGYPGSISLSVRSPGGVDYIFESATAYVDYSDHYAQAVVPNGWSWYFDPTSSWNIIELRP